MMCVRHKMAHGERIMKKLFILTVAVVLVTILPIKDAVYG